jgi:hypothetical protein
MTRTEISQLLKQAKSLDSFIKGDDNQVNAWQATLDSKMPFDFAKTLLIRHYRCSAQTIRPVNFISAWQAELDLRKWREGVPGDAKSHVPATPETAHKFAEMARAEMARKISRNDAKKVSAS